MKKVLEYIFFLPLSLLIWIFWWFNAILSISLLIMISFIIPERFYSFIVRTVCVFLTYSAFIFPRHKGLSPREVPFPVIFVANHVSFFDLFISGTMLPGYPRGLELAEHFKMPIYGWFISRFGQIPIDLKNKGSIKNSFEISIDILKKKIRNIFIMPEGTRTDNGKIGKFKYGAFYLSRKSGYPIVPVLYKGLFKINHKKSILIKPGIVDVIIMPPIFPEDFPNDEEMANYIRELMIKKLEE
jgi:1-acyl-sn-glycerol-3-phosphate acyltransferase